MSVVIATTTATQFVVHGSPSWVDLQTSDGDASSTFYRSLLGWSYRRRFSLNPDVGVYDDHGEFCESVDVTWTAYREQRPTAEILERDGIFADLALSSRWYPYLSVVDIKATLRRVEASGGTVLRSPRARGAMAVVATVMDPDNALICLWQARDQAGCPFAGSDGSMSWIELETPDLDAARRFYGQVFDWVADDASESTTDDQSEVGSDQPSGLIFRTSAGPVAAAIPSMVSRISASWCPGFAVTDVDEATRHAVDLGAVIMTDPYDVPVGRQSVLVDPQGAVLALIGPRRAMAGPLLQLDW